MAKKKESKKFLVLKGVSWIYSVIGILFWVIAFGLVLIPAFPHIWYRVNASATTVEVEALKPQNLEKPEEKKEEEKLPEFDENLSKINSIIIPTIGVNSPINEGQDYEKALEKGSWIVNDFGTPDNNAYSIIIASHRFGYISWSLQQRKEMSFFSLPKTKIGDKIEIIWGQRKYVYEIYEAETAREISDYDADLILYTCLLYNSPDRIFRYAKRIN